MYKLLLTALFCASFAQSYGQDILNKIKQNPDISWAQTTILEFDTDIKCRRRYKQLSGDHYLNLVIKHQMPLQLEVNPEESEYHNFADKIANKEFWSKAKNKCYLDPNLQQLLTAEQIAKKNAVTDTLITFDPEDFSEIVEPIHGTYKHYHISHFKLFLCYAYNSKSQKLEVYPISLAPIVGRFSDEGKLIREKVAFWIPVQTTKKIDAQNANLNWIQKQNLSWRFNYTSGEKLVEKQSIASLISSQIKNLDKIAQTQSVYNSPPILDGKLITTEEIKSFQTKQLPNIKGIFFSYILAWDAQQQKAIIQIEGCSPMSRGCLYFIAE